MTEGEAEARRTEDLPSVVLNRGLQMRHFLPVFVIPMIFGLGSGVSFLFAVFKGRSLLLPAVTSGLLFSLSLLLFRVLYIARRRALRYEVIHSPLEPSENYERVMRLVQDAGWLELKHEKPKLLIATHPWSNRVSSRITIEFQGNRVLANSICDPASNGTYFSKGRGRRDIAAIHEALLAEDPSPESVVPLPRP